MTQLRGPDIARKLGIKQATWRAYVSRGKAPPPDGRFGREPWWHPATIQTWEASRPRAKKPIQP